MFLLKYTKENKISSIKGYSAVISAFLWGAFLSLVTMSFIKGLMREVGLFVCFAFA